MTRKLSVNTVNKFKKKLEQERDNLTNLLERHQEERERVRLSEGSAERSPDPSEADGGSMAFELEKELTLDENTKYLCSKIIRSLQSRRNSRKPPKHISSPASYCCQQ